MMGGFTEDSIVVHSSIRTSEKLNSFLTSTVYKKVEVKLIHYLYNFHEWSIWLRYDMSRDMRKLVFGISDQV